MGLASYKDFEAHVVVGAGLLEIDCCTDDGKSLKHLYVKFCLGAALGVSGGMGEVSESDGQSCSNPPTFMLGGELGASCGVGVEGSATVDTAGGGNLSLAGGGGVEQYGADVKATACWYMLLQTIPGDKECECKPSN